MRRSLALYQQLSIPPRWRLLIRLRCLLEYDIDDCCFENTTSQGAPNCGILVGVSVRYKQTSFFLAINKYTRKSDLVDAFSHAFWDLLFSLFCLAVIDWKISFNLDFVVQKLDGASHANYETKKTPARATMLRAPFFF